MKKILKMMSVLLALGMLFAGCAQSTGGSSGNNTNGNSNSGGSNNSGNNADFRELTLADFDDTSFLIGKFVMDVEDLEMTFTESCPEEFKEIMKSNYITTIKEGASKSGMGDFENKTAEEAAAYAENPKYLLRNGGKMYINGDKTKVKVLQEQSISNNPYLTKVKLYYVYTKQ